MTYTITSFCHGKYDDILPHWLFRTHQKCPTADVKIWTTKTPSHGYAWWDVVRTELNLEHLKRTQIPIVQCDLDIILEKDIEPLVNLPYDIIISTEIGGAKSFPPECSSKLGFGVCTGFYVCKPQAAPFLESILAKMKQQAYNTYSDQVTLMNTIVASNPTVHEDSVVMDGRTFHNKCITLNGLRIGVLDFRLMIRDPMEDVGQFGNHINVDNVRGVPTFIRYFYEPLAQLPLTCRCGKTDLGDFSVCTHSKR